MPSKIVTTPPKPRTKPATDHVSYQDMIIEAIVTLKERNGSSRVALKKYIKANHKNIVDGKMFDSLFNRALKSGVDKGIFAQPKGASGGTKLAKKEPKPLPKPTTKVLETKVIDKKPIEKKTVAKKPVSTKKAVSQKIETSPKAKVVKPRALSKAQRIVEKVTVAIIHEEPAVISRTKSGRITKSTTATIAKKTPSIAKTMPKKSTVKRSAE